MIFFMVGLLNGSYSDGAVGMTPLMVLLIATLAFIVSLIFHRIFTKKLSNKYLILILNMIFYQLIFLPISGSLPILNINSSDFSGFLDRCYSFSSLAACALLLIAAKISTIVSDGLKKGES